MNERDGVADAIRVSEGVIDYIWDAPRPTIPIDHSARTSATNRILPQIANTIFGSASMDDALRAIQKRITSDRHFRWEIEMANEIYSPTAKEVDRAERILVALKEAEAQGKGAASLDGKMIDAASEKMARNMLATAAAIKAAEAARAKS